MADANIEWPEKPVKSMAAIPRPQPIKAIFDSVVMPAAKLSGPSQGMTGRIARVVASIHSVSAAAKGKIMPISPKRVIQ